MSKPSVSILIPTYARTALLAESLYSALSQNYDGDIEIIVVNACPLQTLSCDGVQIFNAPHLANAPLGEIRDTLLRMASGDVCCLWDDDDIYLPDHVGALVAKLREGEPATRCRRMLTWNGTNFRERGGSTNAGHTALFRRTAYGVWPISFELSADTGRADQEFWTRANSGGWFSGRHHHETDGIYTVVVRMETDRLRGSLVETGSVTAGHLREMWDARIVNGEEPRGNVALVPSWSRNWTVAVTEFLDSGKVAFT